jgi:Flp pilus assembly protein TadG
MQQPFIRQHYARLPAQETAEAANRRRSRSQGGSAMLEGALIILPLLAIGFALLDFPLAIFIQNTLRNAVREGVRFAITEQTGPGGQDAAIISTVENNSIGFLNNNALTSNPPTATITIQYYNPISLASASGVGSNAQGNICVVTATIQHTWMVPIWQSSSPLTFTASSSDVMEAPPNGVLPGR